MSNAKRRMGMEDTKARCRCKNRGVFINNFGNSCNKRCHDDDCQYHKKHEHHRL